MSTNDNINFLENIKQGTTFWNHYKSEITTQTKSNNLVYLIDPKFRNIKIFLVLSFKKGDNDPTRNYLMSITFH